MKTPSLSRRTSLLQTILVLLVESGLVYLGIQVSHFFIVLFDICAQDPHRSHRLIDSPLGFDPAWEWLHMYLSGDVFSIGNCHVD